MSGSSHEDDEDRSDLDNCAADHDGNPVGDYIRQFIFQQDDIQDSDLELSAPRTYGVDTTKYLKCLMSYPLSMNKCVFQV